jgi:polyribonucleotide nucleotidyltransferase
VGSPKRREIGHGFLAERALVPVLPSREEFPYAIRQVSEALSSNGSTSMGSVCASTLSLLNAGVPLRAAVAGIAMGLVSDEVNGETRYAALTDILGAEDALGDMDFKVAGTSEFVTAIQLDTKLDGIPTSVLAGALTQARDARLTILNVLNSAIDAPDEMAPTAPRVISVQIPVDKIGELMARRARRSTRSRTRPVRRSPSRRTAPSTSARPTAPRPRPPAPRSTRSPTRPTRRSASSSSARS